MDFKDWRFWLILISSIIAFSLTFIYPHQPQNSIVLEEYQNLEENTYIIIAVQGNNFDEIKKMISKKYPNYSIVDYSFNEEKQIYLIQLKRDDEL